MDALTEITMNKVLREYTDTAGVHHLIISTGDKTGDVVEYTSVRNCPFCGRKFTEDMICKCGINNTNISMQKITLGQLRQYLDCGESIEVVMDDEEWDSFSRIKASSKLLDPFNDWTIIEMGLGKSPGSSLLLPRIRIRN